MTRDESNLLIDLVNGILAKENKFGRTVVPYEAFGKIVIEITKDGEKETEVRKFYDRETVLREVYHILEDYEYSEDTEWAIIRQIDVDKAELYIIGLESETEARLTINGLLETGEEDNMSVLKIK